MIRALLWKEWHEMRARYLLYWLALNAPIVVVSIWMAFSTTARAPFAGLSDATILKYLPIALLEPFLISTVYLLAAGYLGVTTFRPEIEDRSLLFVSEQPVSRRRYVAIKLLFGGLQVALAVWFATVLALSGAYALMLASHRVTLAGSSGIFRAMLAAGLQSAVWSSLVSLIVFTGSALAAALAPRWWMAALGSIALIVGTVLIELNYVDFIPLPANSEPMSFSMNFGSNNPQWVTLSRPLHLDELASFGQWHAWPQLAALLLMVVFAVLVTQVYARKELT